MTKVDPPGRDEGYGQQEPNYERIVVPLDGSPLAEQVMPHVEALALRFGSAILLLQVTRSLADVVAQTMPATTLGMRPAGVSELTGATGLDPQSISDAEQQDAQQYLAGVAQQLQARGLQVDYEVQEGPAAEAIVQTARQMDAGIIAMTTHGRGGLKRLVFGSVADSVLRHSPCPVLLVRVSNASQED